MALPARRTYQPSRWDPFTELDQLHEEMSRLLTNVFPGVGRISVNAWSPPIDVEETDDAYVIEADMPGVAPEDLDVEVQGNELHIVGRIAEDRARRRGRRSGEFDYRVTLPGEVDPEDCSAEIEHGVLRLRLKKTAAATRHRIPVRSGARGEIGASEQGGQTGGQEQPAAEHPDWQS